MKLPPLSAILADAHVVSIPLRVRFRGITTREATLFRGPAGWAEFAPFPEYEDAEASAWLASAVEAAWNGPPPARRDVIAVNATVPAVSAARVPDILARFAGARTAKVKVAEKGQSLAEDVARVNAVREQIPNVRVDANGAWTVSDALRALDALLQHGPLEYVEQPCHTVEELAELRQRLDGAVRVAADESIRRADDPFRVVEAGGADVAVLKVAPLGGARRVVTIAERLGEAGIPVVVSSALDTVVGISLGAATAAALPVLELACGLGTTQLLADDVGPPMEWAEGGLRIGSATVDELALRRLAASEECTKWWRERLTRCYTVLATQA
ncbi:o-succinylbenzoate synthase [Hoyosella subflava]|uniref:o-succinylbenzoate synthase n=1 Tax=Hoyosella subflava (strain DSM 45089 / JCM 17490 / NBRC 109087 / DQS3-9A1) TaxID=443218 RepID=F6EH18_HOYSD|nr:o-succinylbenzoate synthase [Hoyosella subflava]AEF38842.1 O-succinylbenzoic acid synthetase [Hoyosella subflava DQS3-9A1]